MRHIAALAAAVLALLMSFAPAADAAGVHKGMYACEAYNAGTGMITWLYDLRFTSRTRYEKGLPNKGQTKIKDPHRGTYKVKGTRIVFRTGPERSFFGKFKQDDHDVFIVWRKPTKHHEKAYVGSCSRQHR